MGLLAAHLNDAGISVLDSERILYREPGFALLDDDQLTTGSAAYSHALFPRRSLASTPGRETESDGLGLPHGVALGPFGSFWIRRPVYARPSVGTLSRRSESERANRGFLGQGDGRDGSRGDPRSAGFPRSGC